MIIIIINSALLHTFSLYRVLNSNANWTVIIIVINDVVVSIYIYIYLYTHTHLQTWKRESNQIGLKCNKKQTIQQKKDR